MGIFDSLKSSAGTLASGLLSLPGNFAQGYSAGYGAMPQAYRDAAASRQDAAEMRRLDMERARSIASDIASVYGSDPTGRLAQNSTPGFTASVQQELRTPKAVAPGQTLTIGARPVYAAPDYGVADGYAYSADPLSGQLTFGEQRGPTHGEDNQRSSVDESHRSNLMQESIADKTLAQRIQEARDQRDYQMGSLGVQRDELALRRSQAPPGGAAGGAVVITSPDQYNALGSGTQFIAPDGTIRRKP